MSSWITGLSLVTRRIVGPSSLAVERIATGAVSWCKTKCSSSVFMISYTSCITAGGEPFCGDNWMVGVDCA